MVLLTSSQVSVALSSAIGRLYETLNYSATTDHRNAVCLSALALFFAGYVLQQQTVRSLQDSISPRLPSPDANVAQSSHQILDPASKSSRNVFHPKDGSKHRELTVKTTAVQVNWSRLAYLSIVKSHEELCGAVMLFADLVRSKSPAQRVLLFPQHWALESTTSSDGNEEDPHLYTTKRLLKKAARRYRVVLVPMAPVQPNMDKNAVGSYSLTPAFSLRDYDKLVLLPHSGLVLNSMPLDTSLAFSQPDTAVSALAESTDLLEGPLLIQPAKADYVAMMARLRSSAEHITDTDLLSSASPSIPALPRPDDISQLLASTSSLCAYPANPGPASEFNATHFLHHTAFVRLSDQGLPGPEFDVPYATRAEARPRNDGARKVWERMYEKFRAGRQDICGLELEPWSPPPADVRDSGTDSDKEL